MSSKSRYRPTIDQRRRRGAPAAGVGAVVGGAIAAALFSAAVTAHADVVGAATTVTDMDPAADLLEGGPQASAGELAAAQLIDTQLVAANPAVAQVFDTTYVDFLLQTLGTGDIDPAEDLLPADPTTFQTLIATAIDFELIQPAFGNVGATLDHLVDAGTMATPPAIDTDPDPFEDLLGPNATAAQLGVATAADNSLNAFVQGNPGLTTLVGLLDADTDSSLPTGDTLADPFTDMLPANATDAQLYAASALDAQLNFFDPTLAASLDPQVDALVAAPVDNDALADLTQAFGSNGGAFVEFFVQQFVGSSASMQDAAVDSIIASLGLGPF